MSRVWFHVPGFKSRVLSGALILDEREFGSFSQVVSGLAVGEIGWEVSRSCDERGGVGGSGIGTGAGVSDWEECLGMGRAGKCGARNSERGVGLPDTTLMLRSRGERLVGELRLIGGWQPS